MTAIPRPTKPYTGTIGRLSEDCEPVALEMEGAPEGAPNVVIVLLAVSYTHLRAHATDS